MAAQVGTMDEAAAISAVKGPGGAGQTGPQPGSLREIMIVDDSRVQRRILASLLARAGHRVVEVATAAEALERCRTAAPDLIISDWMMPGMTGPDLCASIRALELESYVYFILLTSRTGKSDVVSGLGMGADDFVTKPVNGDELRARVAAGARVLRIERELKQKNMIVSATLAELQGLYDSINRDLIEAKKLQQSLVRERHRSFGNAEVSLVLRPSGHVGGDLVGFFPINAGRVAIYAIDVSGHGITSAMMTARLAGYLSGTSPDQNVALRLTDARTYEAHPPDVVAARLNRIVIEEMQTDSYFTLAYADVDLATGIVSLVQAGHPNPAILRGDGAVTYIGDGGMPIGLFDDATFAAFDVRLNPGERLFLMSDGFIEAMGRGGAMLGEEGLARLLTKRRDLTGPALLEALLWDLADFAGEDFGDDVSGAMLHFRGPKMSDG